MAGALINIAGAIGMLSQIIWFTLKVVHPLWDCLKVRFQGSAKELLYIVATCIVTLWSLALKKLLAALCLGFFAFGASADTAQQPQTYIVSTQVYFSPNGGAQKAIIDQINAAKKSIFVQAYSFTNQPIVKALVEANKRGVDVFVILDKSNKTDKYSVADLLDHYGIDTYIDSKEAIAHNKVMILDKEVVITGSYNFTNAAEHRNAENVLVIQSQHLADAYFENWAVHQKHSVPYVGRDR